MDLEIHSRALWRYRRLVVAGVILAVALAVLSTARPTLDGGTPSLVYRTNEGWQSQAKLLLTRPGFREGRVTPTADYERFSQLADLYAALVTSDPVMQMIKKQGPVGTVTATAVRGLNGGPSPLVQIAGIAGSPEKAKALTTRATEAFLAYLSRRQSGAAIPQEQRVRVSVLEQDDPPILIEPRKKTLPVMILLAVLSATFGLVYVLERTRQRQRGVVPVKPAPAEQLAAEAIAVEPIAAEPLVADPVFIEPATETPDEQERVATRRWA